MPETGVRIPVAVSKVAEHNPNPSRTPIFRAFEGVRIFGWDTQGDGGRTPDRSGGRRRCGLPLYSARLAPLFFEVFGVELAQGVSCCSFLLGVGEWYDDRREYSEGRGAGSSTALTFVDSLGGLFLVWLVFVTGRWAFTRRFVLRGCLCVLVCGIDGFEGHGLVLGVFSQCKPARHMHSTNGPASQWSVRSRAE
jgi:hypothetical protein